MADYLAQPMQNKAKQPELAELHTLFGDVGQRLEKCFQRLRDVGNRLMDESGSISEAKPSQPEPSPRLPGITSSLYQDHEGLRILVGQIELQLNKLESQI